MSNDERPYHKYVFSSKERKFVGKFEDMYRNEHKQGYDSWYQENLSEIDKIIPLSIIGKYNFNKVCDVGCGKGVFTHLLKKNNNSVIGIDISKTAITKARTKFPEIDFRVMGVGEFSGLDENFDLIVAMEILSYISSWEEVIKTFSTKTNYLFISLYLPEDPIGYVKNFDSLVSIVKKYFIIETEILIDREQLLLMARKK